MKQIYKKHPTGKKEDIHQERGILVSVLIFLLFRFCTCIHTITLTRPLKDGDVLVSNGDTFALGFFSPEESTNRYVGIWYNKISEQTVVWVANRDRPITNTSGILSVDQTGNLVLHKKDQSFVFWSTNVSRVANDHVYSAQLLDSGNLVVFHEGPNQEVIYSWQSFDHPTNTILPGLRFGLDRKTGLNRVITSWKSSGNPGVGDYTYKMEVIGLAQMFLLKGMTPIWRSGSWMGHGWGGVPEMTTNSLYNFTYINNNDEVVVVFLLHNSSVFSRVVVNDFGTVERLTWLEEERKWVGFWSVPKDRCDGYNRCGLFGLCDPSSNSFVCDCLPGYEPRNLWDGYEGCKRKAGTRICKAGDGFVELVHIKLPDTSTARVNMSLGLEGCLDLCLKDCTCMGHALADFSKGTAQSGGCITWYGNMIDTRTFSNGGQSFYMRVDAADLAKYSSKTKNRSHRNRFLVIVMPILIVAGFLLCTSICCYVRKKRAKRNEASKVGISFINSLKTMQGSFIETDIGKNVDLDVFDLSTIAMATDNFSPSNKLGEGGFGSVYKGKLLNGLEVAVKRLSHSSGQGMQEFMNEVSLIAKLQHMNLVRLLGYCFCEEEKMLVYEYLPNKGLDSFIFDQENTIILDWKTRFQIIQGIVRGLLYLHHDSRLKIIHRDLKASNVLLDTDLNPKISDFGMAKIFGGDVGEAKTRRVVGTYGYMSPEYAMQGLYSVKSDVFSFGILVLEIISGRKNNSYSQESSINLIGHVWDLWKQEKPLTVVDASLGDSYDAREVLLCIHVGILCVQELAADRPTMNDVAFMLSNHETVLPAPNQPAFIFRQLNYGKDCDVGSVYDDTITTLHAR